MVTGSIIFRIWSHAPKRLKTAGKHLREHTVDQTKSEQQSTTRFLVFRDEERVYGG